MPLSMDTDYATVMAPVIAILAKATPLPVGQVERRRKGSDRSIRMFTSNWEKFPDVERSTIEVQAADGFKIPVHVFQKKGVKTNESTPAVLFTHGGGFMSLGGDVYSPVVDYYCSHTGIPMFMPDYRLAPEHPFPTPFEDCYTVLRWLYQNTKSLNIDSTRIGVVGDSAGGNLSATLAIKSRDDNLTPPLALSAIFGGMLDDRSMLKNYDRLKGMASLSKEDVLTSWNAYIGADKVGGSSVSQLAAPARATDLQRLPNTYIDVSQLDIFCGENIEYAGRLAAAEVNVEFHVWPGVPHAFDFFAYHIPVTQTALKRRASYIKSLWHVGLKAAAKANL